MTIIFAVENYIEPILKSVSFGSFMIDAILKSVSFGNLMIDAILSECHLVAFIFMTIIFSVEIYIEPILKSVSFGSFHFHDHYICC